jgi:hypothetical protein
MNLSEYAKRLADRAAERRAALAAEAMPQWPTSVADRAQVALDPVEDGTGAWIAAGLVDMHDEVNAAGVWHIVTGTNKSASRFAESDSVVLLLAGRSEPMGYMALVYARDARSTDGGAL